MVNFIKKFESGPIERTISSVMNPYRFDYGLLLQEIFAIVLHGLNNATLMQLKDNNSHLVSSVEL